MPSLKQDKRNVAKRKYNAANKDKVNKWYRTFYLKHSTPAKRRAYVIRHRYGMTQDDFERMAKEQDGKCLVCGQVPGGRGLVIDHKHGTKTVRGLLCTGCNVGVGFYEKMGTLAQAYLERHKHNGKQGQTTPE